MANPYVPIDPFRVSFQRGSVADRPIPPPGLDYDNQARESLSAAYPASKQVTVITLGGASALDETSVLTITPLLMANGSPWPDELAPVALTYTDPGTATLAGVGAGWTAAAAAAQTIVDLADISNFQRVLDLVTVTDNGAGVVTLTGAQEGATFSYTITGTSTVDDTGGVTTTGATPDPLGVGLIGVNDGRMPNDMWKIKAPITGSVSADILGIVLDSIHVREGEPADVLRYYERPGPDVLYRPWGTGTVYAETAVSVDDPVWVRIPGAGGIPGAVAGADGGSHILYTGATHMRTTTAAGPAAIIIAHP